jgi:hypothetical protein
MSMSDPELVTTHWPVHTMLLTRVLPAAAAAAAAGGVHVHVRP